MHAVRNIKLCTKDCLCLYVCPTGATDTETGQIDANKCIDGCRKCVDACPSHAISLIPEEFPKQQEKGYSIKKIMFELLESKVQQENIASEIEKNAKTDTELLLARAIKKSNRLMAEDILRESEYMLPQSEEVKVFLESIKGVKENDFPKEVLDRLLDLFGSKEST